MPKNLLRIGIFELTGCAGDALLILDCEDELVNIFRAASIEAFLMAKSDNSESPLDVALVEGSVSTKRNSTSSRRSARGLKSWSPSAVAPATAGSNPTFSTRKHGGRT